MELSLIPGQGFVFGYLYSVYSPDLPSFHVLLSGPPSSVLRLLSCPLRDYACALFSWPGLYVRGVFGQRERVSAPQQRRSFNHYFLTAFFYWKSCASALQPSSLLRGPDGLIFASHCLALLVLLSCCLPLLLALAVCLTSWSRQEAF